MSLLEVKNLTKHYGNNFKALDKFNLLIEENKVVGLVGESGCGKSTLSNLIMKLDTFDEGEILFQGRSINAFKGRDLKAYRKSVQIVFQNVLMSLNPRMKILDIVSEPLKNFTTLSKDEIKIKVENMLEKVGLNKNDITKYPRQFSGGERQRISIARAMIINPKLLIFDEATSSLDVSIQSQILNLINDLKKEYKTSYLFISHDLGVIRYISDITYVMYRGSNIEILESEKLLEESKHPYTRLLLESVPLLNEKNIMKTKSAHCCEETSHEGRCKFFCRCSDKKDICKINEVILKDISDKHKIACLL
ncbi:MAG: oligopeptide/dipeptide ABC transporter ATP-binding protein [Sarcina sp.]